MIQLENPYILLLIIPIAIILYFFIRYNFVNVQEEPLQEKRRKIVRIIMLATRILIFLALLIAIASPYQDTQKIIQGDPILKIVVDNSTSMNLFKSIQPDFFDKLKQKVDVEITTAGYGETSDIGDGALGALGPYESVLLISDGQATKGASMGDVALYAQKLNSTINGITLTQVHDDASVWIDGPAKTMADAENTFAVNIGRVGKTVPIHLIVTLDGQTVIDKTTTNSQETFTEKLTEGYHELIAKLDTQDYFPQNNIYYKSIKTVPRPKILLVTETETPLQQLLSQVFNVDVSPVPKNLDDYYAVIINNMDADKMNPYTSQLNDFLVGGSGMLVIGGKNSFNYGKYRNSIFEGLLPVYVAEAGKKQGDMNVVIVIDKSGSTGSGFGSAATTVDVEKAMAIDVLQNDIGLTNKVGVVAFDTEAYLVSELSTLSEKSGDLQDRIARIVFGGGTFIHAGILKSLQLLEYASGAKNIILISDGRTQAENTAYEAAKAAANLGVTIYTVGVGESTADDIMLKIADLTGGIYFKATDSSRLRILFGKPDENAKTDTPNIYILNKNHFITQGLDTQAVISGFNEVVPKTAAQLLVTTGIGDPILTIWRLGLGRVGAWSTDDGINWAGQLLSGQNSPLLIRTINWAIGEPDRKAQERVEVADTHVFESTDVVVKSQSVPKAEGTAFYKIDENTYSGTIVPMQTGFQQILTAKFAVNYPVEYQLLGQNIEPAVQISGGKMFSENDIDKIVDAVKSRATRMTVTRETMRWPFIVFALVLFLLEIFIRRWLRKE